MYQPPRKSKKVQLVGLKKSAPDTELEQWTHASKYSSECGRDGFFNNNKLVGDPEETSLVLQGLRFRYYGQWLKKKSFETVFSPLPGNKFISTDYADCNFYKKVYPKEVRIFETHNPGAVVRILAAEKHPFQHDVVTKWFELWNGPSMVPGKVPRKSRIFSPSLKKCPFETNLIRLEICSESLDSYVELIAVSLVSSDTHRGDRSGSEVGHSKVNMVDIVAPPCMLSSENTHGLLDLPDEMIVKILTFLDRTTLLSLGQTCKTLATTLLSLGQTCKRLATLSSDSQPFKNIDLQIYWPIVSCQTLRCLSPRLSSVVALNMSWCGSYRLINETDFDSFISNLSELRILKLFSCDFMTTSCLQSIAKHCKQLEELDIGSCTNIKEFDAVAMLTSIRRLNLYRTLITDKSLTLISKSCPGITDLGIASCRNIKEINVTAKQIGLNCHFLKSIDLWTCKLSMEGLMDLISHSVGSIEEMELRWCWSLGRCIDPLNDLLKKCVNLRVLALSLNINDVTLEVLGDCCPNLEVLISAYRKLSPESVDRLLEKCSKLKFLNVHTINTWYEFNQSLLRKWQTMYSQCTFQLYSQWLKNC